MQQEFPLGKKLTKITAKTLKNQRLAQANADEIDFDVVRTNDKQFFGIENQNQKRNNIKLYFEVPLSVSISTFEVEDALTAFLLEQGEDVANIELTVSLADLLKDCKRFEISVLDKYSKAKKLEKLLRDGILKFTDEIKK
jgi:hypothetical protein